MNEPIRNLKSIQVFQAVFRLRSMSRASLELGISQSSITYHIKKLESEIGVSLFHRTSAGLEPTEHGELLATYVERGFSSIRSGLDQIASRRDSVRVALLPMFASRWLSSRLGGFLEAHLDLQLSIQSHNNTYARMANPEGFADLGVNWGQGDWGGFHISRLWVEQLVVVCSPSYARAHPITTPADLRNCTLLHVDDTRMWEEWFANNGERLARSHNQMMLEDRHFQLSSTINGLGVSLFASWAVQNELRKGDLIDPFGRTFGTSFAYYLLVPWAKRQLRPVQVFCDWLLSISHDGPHESLH